MIRLSRFSSVAGLPAGSGPGPRPGLRVGGLLLLLLLLLLVAACSSNKAGMKSPELPRRHWLEDAPGVPVENKEKLEAVVPNLYDPEKQFSFEELVFLTIQQSPLLVNSAVDLEINRLARTNAGWKYLPEPRMTLMVSNNVTRYNMDMRNTPSDYGRPRMRATFYAPFPNPVATYFENKVQQGLVNVAISTHRKAVGDVLYEMAQSYLKLEARRRILAEQKGLLPLGTSLVQYWQQVEAVDGRQGTALDVARQSQRERELNVEKSTQEETIERTRIKLIAGVEPEQRLKVDTDNAESILDGFDGHALKWEDRWTTTEDELLLRAQLRLSDYNIMLAWAQYVPSITFYLNDSPPAGQYQPPNGQDDYFLHVAFTFPLIDWGRRYRDVQTARMKKAQAFHDIARRRTEYSYDWLQAEQRVSLAETDLKVQKIRLETADMKYKEARIAFDEGTAELPVLVEREEAAANARINYIRAELEYNLARLQWMYRANMLQERYLGPPAKEII
ncbi:TolC family protein [Desulfovibrio sp.]|uniref:TolC family protein n=1 Tax=Desulfovibrio sp. TaxID=885 RepID=UPI0023CB8AE1|nr:TolC family protein [Desulfovibrio sp.]MDE7242082.1 TolC family protein [Desulfovibrio sp.]